ncbi:3-isopropylmalate dehydrogenase [Cysteiniphilum sp. QT6929]|nr:3-isopropylmalate dehydrogenase [Cysteiniphilum sp. QT6929]WHN65049.1 3-isopropylmalate dehydrogenase [Cysteiniphilum sp. QT6929]
MEKIKKTIAILAGDGIGPEVMACAIDVLDAVANKYNHEFTYKEALIGGAAFDVYAEHCPKQTIDICKSADAILFGSVGGPVDAQNDPKWQGCEAKSILALRKTFDFGVNIRPIKMFPALKNNSPIKNERIANGADIEIFRELSGDIYFGEHKRFVNKEGIRCATDVAEYDEQTIRHIVRAAFKRAGERRKILTSIDKANVLDTSRLWRDIANEEAKNFPDMTLKHMYVDNAAMQLVLNPAQFDVIVTGNLFGDILSDLASVLPGSLGLVPSISLNKEGFGLYEPAGGSAFDIMGKDIANPIAQILSAALMLSYSFGMHEEAIAIDQAIDQVLAQGFRTADIAGGAESIGSKEITQKIVTALTESALTY